MFSCLLQADCGIAVQYLIGQYLLTKARFTQKQHPTVESAWTAINSTYKMLQTRQAALRLTQRQCRSQWRGYANMKPPDPTNSDREPDNKPVNEPIGVCNCTLSEDEKARHIC